MRPILVVLLALALVPLAPTALSDTEQGATVGVNLGAIAPGLWDAFWYQHPGGGASFSLSWAPSLFPGADYDLHVYKPGALDDGYLAQSELVAKSGTRTFAAHTEAISASLPAARYVVAVVPFQTQGEVYTLSATPGQLQYAAAAVGFIAYT